MHGHRVSALGTQTSLEDRKRRAGQRLVIGFDGEAVTDDLRILVRELRPAGFVLFSRNIVEPTQVLELNLELASLIDAHHPAFLCVDQEGGRVQRIREPATRWPTMRTLGRCPDLIDPVARAMATELRSLGFNLNFAPVADVDSNPDNPVIGDRAFARTANEVSDLAVRFLRAHQDAGIICCGKHFPGHGDTRTDSHEELPIVEREEPELREIELAPFRALLSAEVGSIMTAHVVYPAFDEQYPATLSQRIVPPLLRQEMGYDGVVFSDDLEMKAVHGRFPVVEQVERLTAATVDILLVCHTAELQLEMFRAMVHHQERISSMDRTYARHTTRIHAMRERFLHSSPGRPPLSVLGCTEHKNLALLAEARGGA